MFQNCKMVGTFFDSCIMEGTYFIENDMKNARLDNSNATKASFIRCNVTNLSLKNTNIDGAIFEDCIDNGVPITKEWLRDHGALNVDNATVINSTGLELSVALLSLSK